MKKELVHKLDKSSIVQFRERKSKGERASLYNGPVEQRSPVDLFDMLCTVA
jgi:hypothetical protein